MQWPTAGPNMFHRLLARSVDVFYTRKDSILSSFFRLGEGLHAFFQAEHRENHEALGLLGPFDDTDEIGAFDLKEEVSSHSAREPRDPQAPKNPTVMEKSWIDKPDKFFHLGDHEMHMTS